MATVGEIGRCAQAAELLKEGGGIEDEGRDLTAIPIGPFRGRGGDGVIRMRLSEIQKVRKTAREKTP